MGRVIAFFRGIRCNRFCQNDQSFDHLVGISDCDLSLNAGLIEILSKRQDRAEANDENEDRAPGDGVAQPAHRCLTAATNM